MSYYYNYYLGYRNNETKKFYVLGLFDNNEHLYSIISKSRSFASNLHEMFIPVKTEDFSESIYKYFSYKNVYNDIVPPQIKWFFVKDLPSDSFIKTGYFLIDEVEQYERNKDGDEFWFEGFSHSLSPQVYAAKLQNEIICGKNSPKKDVEGNEYIVPNASDYMYYAFPDYNSKEYESHILRKVAEAYDFVISENCEMVILETEG